MKKILSALLALTMLLALTACGGSGGGTTSGGGGDSTKPEVKGETTEVGDFSVLVPEVVYPLCSDPLLEERR